MPRITVYIPAYNHEPFVGAAIRSVLEQTYTDWELIVVDDASTDGTLREIRKFQDPRMRVIEFTGNQGAASAANLCITKAAGDFVCPLSSDDVFLPDKLARQVSYLKAHPDVLAVTAAPEFIDEGGRPLTGMHNYSGIFTSENRTREQWLKHFFFHGCNLAHTSFMVRRSAYDQVGMYEHLLRQSPDLDLFVRLVLLGEIHVMEGPQGCFRVRDQDQNLSAPKPSTIGNMQLELSWSLRRYLHPFVLNNRAGVFGEEWGHHRSEAEARLTLAEIAWSVRNPAHRTFAAHVLFDTSMLGLDAAAVEDFRRRARSMLVEHDVYRFMEAEEWAQKKRRLQEQKVRLQQKLDGARAKLDGARAENDAFKQSLSWKVTKPLRALQRLLRKPKA